MSDERWARRLRREREARAAAERIAEDKVREFFQLNRTLSEALERAQAAERAKSRFLGIVSHEFRTPLNAIRGYAELLADAAADGEALQPEDFSRILRATGHLSRLVEDVLDLTAAERGRLSMRVRSVDLVLLLEDAVDLHQTDIDARQPPRCTFEAVRIETDPHRLRQVVLHLLSNASKFGGDRPVALTAGPRSDGAFIEVSDQGPGMPEAAVQQLLEPFVQFDDSSTRHRDGLGIGLALTQRIVQQLHGGLDVRTAPGQGCTVCVFLPRTP